MLLDKMLKIISVFFVLALVVGQGCEDSENKSMEKSSGDNEMEEKNEVPDDELDDGLDDALAELDELKDI